MWSEEPSRTSILFKYWARLRDKKPEAFVQQKNLLKKEIFINNSTFLGCLHSKGMVLHAHLNLLENMPQYQPLR